MLLGLSIVILFIIYFDIFLFKFFNQDLFDNVFSISKRRILFFVVLLPVFVFAENNSDLLPAFVWIIFVPFYLLRRRLFVKAADDGVFAQVDFDKKVYVHISDALGLIIKWFFWVLFFSFVLEGVIPYLKPFNSELGEIVLTGVFSSFLLVLFIRKVSKRFSGASFMTNVCMKLPENPLMKVFIVPSIIGLMFACISAYVIISRPVQPQTPLNEVLDTATSPVVILCFLFLAVIVAPFIEELTFRGYLYKLAKTFKGSRFALYFVAFMFAALHYPQYWGDWLAIVMVTILGFILTILRAWTNTALSSTVMHYVYNAGVTLIPVIMIIFSNPAYFKYSAYYDYYDSQTKESLLQESIKIRPEFAAAYNDLAWIYADERKNLDEGLILINKALQLNPDVPEFIDTKIRILFLLKKYDEAVELRDYLLNKYPKWKMDDYLTSSVNLP